jgi:hypothetical protein
MEKICDMSLPKILGAVAEGVDFFIPFIFLFRRQRQHNQEKYSHNTTKKN